MDELPPHVVDVQRVVGKDGIPNCWDVGKRNSVAIPGKFQI